MGSLDGKVALVTGGGSGIGRASAVALARDGARVVVAGRREDAGRETERLVREAGGEALFVRTDVTREEEVKALVGETVQRFGRLDVAFNNAGTEGRSGPLPELTERDYADIFDANVKGVFFSLKYEIPELLRQGGGSIINNSSVAGAIGLAAASLYVASKHAVLGLTRSAAVELATAHIRVNAVSPGGVQTDMFERFTGGADEAKQWLIDRHPVGRVARPEEIADAVVWLASDRASFVTGQSLFVDGGFTAQ